MGRTSTGTRSHAFHLPGAPSPRTGHRFEALLKHDFGILVAPTGFGKTVLAAALIAARHTPTLILIHRTTLLRQWRERLQNFLGLSSRDIGRLHRDLPRKRELLVYDYVDEAIPIAQRMFARRQRGYRELGYILFSSRNDLPFFSVSPPSC